MKISFYAVRITLLVVRVLEEARGRPGRGDLAVSQNQLTRILRLANIKKA
jgi:hypothetical protein